MSRGVIAVFGANGVKRGTEAFEEAWEIGKGLARAGFVVMTGGYRGTMEAVSEGARGAGGEVIGVTVEPWGPPNEFVTQSVALPDLLTRLDHLVREADAYVILPGGTGTLLEIALVLEHQFKGSQPERPIWFLGPSWSPVVKAALEGQEPGKWIGGESRMPECRFFESPRQIVEAADRHFG